MPEPTTTTTTPRIGVIYNGTGVALVTVGDVALTPAALAALVAERGTGPATVERALAEAERTPYDLADALGALQSLRAYLWRVRDQAAALAPVHEALTAYVDAPLNIDYWRRLKDAVATARAAGALPPAPGRATVGPAASALAARILDERARKEA